MKKIISLLLAILLLATMLPGCSGSKVQVPKEYQEYVMPWELDAKAAAIEDGCIHYYFMSGEGGKYGAEDDPVKWGDSCLVVFPNGTTMLIDAGMAEYGAVLSWNLKKLGIEQLDYFMLSHPHNDHGYGAVKGGILQDFGVKEVFYNGIYNNAWGDPQIVENICKQMNVPCTVLRKGDVLTFGGVSMEVLWPQPEFVGQTLNKTADINNTSLVVRFDYGEHSSLFTGDLYMKGERDIMAEQSEKLDVDLLKMCHHGDDTSNHRGFGDATTPEIAVATGYIYVTTQNYQNYTRHGAKVLLDSQDGYIHVTAAQDGTMTSETSREREINPYEQYEYKG